MVVTNSLVIHQDAVLSVAELNVDGRLSLALDEGRHGYLHVAFGKVRVGDTTLTGGDAITFAGPLTWTSRRARTASCCFSTWPEADAIPLSAFLARINQRPRSVERGRQRREVLSEVDETIPSSDAVVPQKRNREMRSIGLPVILFVATCISTYSTGGLPFALALMTTLLAHEFGPFHPGRAIWRACQSAIVYSDAGIPDRHDGGRDRDAAGQGRPPRDLRHRDHRSTGRIVFRAVVFNHWVAAIAMSCLSTSRRYYSWASRFYSKAWRT